MTQTDPQPQPPARAPSRVEAGVLAARQLMEQRRFGEALALATQLKLLVPENRDVLYLVAVNQRYVGKPQEALKTLEAFEALHPAYGRLHQERGHCLRTLGDRAGAIAAYRRAVQFNATLPASWKFLALLCREQGLDAEAAHSALIATNLERLHPTVLAANSMFAEGEVQRAEGTIRPYLLEHPRDIEAMRLLARIGMRMEVLDDAEFLLENVLEIDPQYHAARLDYAQVLFDRQKHAQALEQAQQLLKVEPANEAFRTLAANALVGLGRHDEALRELTALRDAQPANPVMHLAIGHAQKTIGRQAEAIESYRNAARLRPAYGDAWWSLANLKTYRFGEEDIAAMREREQDAATGMEDRIHLCFALGKALEDRGAYAESFAYYDRGNAMRREGVSHDPDRLERNLRRQMEICDGAFFAGRRDWGHAARDPIFIVGLPRAGSTLIEQILASHPQVEGTRELADVPRLVHRLNGREMAGTEGRYPDVLATLDAATVAACGEQYIADTRIYRGERPRFIDKMPNNFRHIALIHLMLPNATIIDARREPMACCFSNFKQLFASGQEFTYGLEDIGRYYRIYVEAMAHWDRVLPGRVLRVQHEDVVDDLEGSVRRLLDHCGLPFDQACLEFHRTERSVRTASSEQVRRPINREGLDQWKHYEAYLGPLKAALGDLVG